MRFGAGGARRQGCKVLSAWRCLCLSLLLAGFMSAGSARARSEPSRNVLVLFSNGRLLPANVEADRAMSEVLASRPDVRAELWVEFLDAPRFSGEAYAHTVATYLREKYAARAPKAIITMGPEALEFVLGQRAQLFAQASVIHMFVTPQRLRALAPLSSDVIGVPVELNFLDTVALALRLQPATRRLVVVTGSSEGDRDWEARIRQQAAALEPRLSIEYLAGLGSAELKRRLGALPPDSIVFTPGYFRDGDGRFFAPQHAVKGLAAASAVAVYGPFPTFIGSGIVGGSMPSFAETGRLAAQAAIALIDGAAPASITLPPTLPSQLQLDWRQVQRFSIASEAVPPDAVVHFREPSFWQLYRRYLLIAGAVFLIQSALIVALLVERRRRQRTAAALAQSEQRMSLAAQAARLSVWSWDLGPTPATAHTPLRRSSDLPLEHSGDFNEVLAAVVPQDRDALETAARRALASGEAMEVEYRIQGKDGEAQWMAARGRAADGNAQRLLGVTLDITPRKRAEAQAEHDRAALRHMTRVSLLGQLSASIAHQLNQPLASILANAEAAQAMLRRHPVDLPELREICDDIVAEDHRAAEVIRRLAALFKRGEPQLVPLDVNELLGDTLELARTNLLTRHVRPVLHLAAALPRIDGDRVQLQQLLLNLIVNAADTMDATPRSQRQLSLSTALCDAQVQVCVADRGPGIAASDMPHLFEPFWSTKAGGMGIGLAICRSIAAVHRGSLSAANAPGGGAVFCLRLPAGTTP